MERDSNDSSYSKRHGLNQDGGEDRIDLKFSGCLGCWKSEKVISCYRKMPDCETAVPRTEPTQVPGKGSQVHIFLRRSLIARKVKLVALRLGSSSTRAGGFIGWLRCSYERCSACNRDRTLNLST